MTELIKASIETLEMTFASLFISYFIGLPLGVLTCETSRDGMFPNRVLNLVFNFIIGFGRAIPFTILMILALPFTRFIVGTGVGTIATIVPLSLAAIPFVARTVEQSLLQTHKSTVEAALVDHASFLRVVVCIKIGSRLYDLVDSIGITSVAIISYTAMAGTLGGGGLGNYALIYGYYRYDWLSVVHATIIIVIIVLFFQLVTRFLSYLLDWRQVR